MCTTHLQPVLRGRPPSPDLRGENPARNARKNYQGFQNSPKGVLFQTIDKNICQKLTISVAKCRGRNFFGSKGSPDPSVHPLQKNQCSLNTLPSTSEVRTRTHQVPWMIPAYLFHIKGAKKWRLNGIWQLHMNIHLIFNLCSPVVSAILGATMWLGWHAFGRQA